MCGLSRLGAARLATMARRKVECCCRCGAGWFRGQSHHLLVAGWFFFFPPSFVCVCVCVCVYVQDVAGSSRLDSTDDRSTVLCLQLHSCERFCYVCAFRTAFAIAASAFAVSRPRRSKQSWKVIDGSPARVRMNRMRVCVCVCVWAALIATGACQRCQHCPHRSTAALQLQAILTRSPKCDPHWGNRIRCLWKQWRGLQCQ